jgi:phage gp29-like protein
MSLYVRTLEALGMRERASERPRKGVQVMPELSLWQQFQRIGGGLTPGTVSNILREADSGSPSRLMDLANECRQKDGHLHGCLEQSELSVSGLPWELVLPHDAKAKEKRAAEWLEAECRGNPSFLRMVMHLTGAVYYGFAVSEIVWGKKDGKLVPASFENIDARRFAFTQEGTFVWHDQGNTAVDFLAEYPNKFIVSRPRVNGDVPCREGLARLLVWGALFRNWTLTDWLRLGEIAWKPWRIGTYKKGAAKEDIDGLVDVLDGMSSNGVCKVPETIEVDVKWAPGASTKPTHEVLFETVAREMSKAILGQTETIQSSTSSGYAQAKVHADVRRDLREARAKQLAFDLTRDVLRPMIELNFGPGVRVPQFSFVTQDPVDLAAFSVGVKNLGEAGLKIPQSWVRDKAGIPMPKDDEELLGSVDIPIDPATGLPAEPAAPPPPPSA